MQRQFKSEKEFEDALINKLTKTMGQWDPNVLEYKSEKDLIENWKQIIFINNNTSERLNDCELTDNEMKQIVDYFSKKLITPFEINRFLNSSDSSIQIERDNINDKVHYKKKITIELFNKKHNAGGSSVYQIARQPILSTNREHSKKSNRGDFSLLINGMPLIHVELKNDSLDSDKLREGINQIKQYKHDGAFTGIFSLVQIFVVLTPTKHKYFANQEKKELFNEKFMFNWCDEENKPLNSWEEFATKFLSIPMAHYLVSYYSVAENDKDSTGPKILKVLRSYQSIVVQKILDIVKNKDWESNLIKGGYVYHTTGSGKTLTCFKAAELIASLTSVDKIVFLLDEVQLYDQTFKKFNHFSNNLEILETSNTNELSKHLLSSVPTDKIIVTSIQKMSKLTNMKNEPSEYELEINKIKSKKIVFIVDEAHRTTNGQMLAHIKLTYNTSLLFGFTGTPIFDENKTDTQITTQGLFGDELHRYTMLEAIRDKSVLEINNDNNLTTYDVKDFIKKLANTKYPENPDKYCEFINKVNQYDLEKKYSDPLKEYYSSDNHKLKVAKDICSNFNIRSYNKFFHHILATRSISDAIRYYHIFQKENIDGEKNDLNVA